MEKEKKITELNFFPDYSYFERAINYPYLTPDYAYSFFKGKFIQGIHLDLEKRIPILSVGSNRAPMQLKRKFSINQDLCVTPAVLYNSDIVYAASISAYGSIPATQWPSINAEVELNVLWLTQEQLNVMHLTEAVGIAYNFVKMNSGTVKIKDFEFKESDEKFEIKTIGDNLMDKDNKSKNYNQATIEVILVVSCAILIVIVCGVAFIVFQINKKQVVNIYLEKLNGWKTYIFQHTTHDLK